MNWPITFRPRLVDTLKGYSRSDFLADGIAGLTVGIIALPLAMAFAIASGVKPEAGIFTAVIAGFLISVLGGTRIAIGRPTGAFIVILYGIDRIGRENVCAHIDAALARAREILGLPPAPPTDPLHGEREKLEAARHELAGALERVNQALNSQTSDGSGLSKPAREP